LPRRKKPRAKFELPVVDEQTAGVEIVRDEDGEPELDRRGLPILRRTDESETGERWMTLLFAACSEMGMTPAARARMKQTMTDAKREAKTKTP
jgi:truncated hemoglobin YjbI